MYVMLGNALGRLREAWGSLGKAWGMLCECFGDAWGMLGNASGRLGEAFNVSLGMRHAGCKTPQRVQVNLLDFVHAFRFKDGPNLRVFKNSHKELCRAICLAGREF